MILAEALCFIPYYFGKDRESKEKSAKPSAKITTYFAPLFIDLFSSNISFIGLQYISGSVYSIMDSSSVVFTAIFSKLILKSSFERAQIWGSFIIIIAAIISGIG
jgi:drug/metabolite transporter (DMT)-like permease